MMIDQIPDAMVELLRSSTDICVLSSGLPPGAQCIGAAGSVHETLRYYGVPSKIVAGGLCYRVGPDQYRDVLAYCGRGNRADLDTGGLFHAWVEARASTGAKWMVDFTPKHWANQDNPVREVMPGVLPAIEWWVKLPDQFFGPISDYVYRLRPGERTPPLGKMTLIPCDRATAHVRKMLELLPSVRIERSAA